MPNQNIKLSGFPKFWVGELSARVAVLGIEVASVIELSEASGRVAAGLFMTEG